MTFRVSLSSTALQSFWFNQGAISKNSKMTGRADALLTIGDWLAFPSGCFQPVECSPVNTSDYKKIFAVPANVKVSTNFGFDVNEMIQYSDLMPEIESMIARYRPSKALPRHDLNVVIPTYFTHLRWLTYYIARWIYAYAATDVPSLVGLVGDTIGVRKSVWNSLYGNPVPDFYPQDWSSEWDERRPQLQRVSHSVDSGCTVDTTYQKWHCWDHLVNCNCRTVLAWNPDSGTATGYKQASKIPSREWDAAVTERAANLLSQIFPLAGDSTDDVFDAYASGRFVRSRTNRLIRETWAFEIGAASRPNFGYHHSAEIRGVLPLTYMLCNLAERVTVTKSSYAKQLIADVMRFESAEVNLITVLLAADARVDIDKKRDGLGLVANVAKSLAKLFISILTGYVVDWVDALPSRNLNRVDSIRTHIDDQLDWLSMSTPIMIYRDPKIDPHFFDDIDDAVKVRFS